MTDNDYILRALQLAEQGELSCAPNPMVGAVVVGPDGRILGEGYHIRTGEGHAEVNALNAVKKEDWPLLPESTIYVSLEPCAHYGKTPPCAALIVKRRLKRCVIGCIDPFSRVSGKGVEMLRQGGVEVDFAPEELRQQCLRLNKRFICQHRLGRPFITLKWAETRDGFIGATDRRLIISTPESRMFGHRLRASHQAIVVGHNTLLQDAPRLDIRHWASASHRGGEMPGVYILGRVGEEELPHGWQAFAHIDDLLENMQREGQQSLLVEGGAQVLQSFIERDLWDEAWAEQGTDDAHDAEGQRLSEELLVAAPKMPREFYYEDEQHFGRTFRHWESPLLKENYGL